MRIVHLRREYDPYGRGSDWAGLPHDQREEVLVEGIYLTPDGEPMSEAVAKRVRHRLLGTFDHLPRPGDTAGAGEVSYLLDGLWMRGAIPILSGNQKAGKSTVVADLAVSLLTPGRRFLGRFESLMTEEERERGVWVINAENPPALFEEEVWSQYEEGTSNSLTIEHLDALGGASAMDLTDPAIYDLWLNRFVECVECQGVDDTTPAVVIVDGMTAIVGSDTSRYAEWYAKFKQLMRELDVPSALAVGHSTIAGTHLMGGIESLGAPDGLWSYWSQNADRPSSPRWFSAVPRLGMPAVDDTRVHKTEGRLHLDAAASPAQPSASIGQDETYEGQVRERLDEAGAAGLRRSEVTGGGREGGLRRTALNGLIERGEVVTRTEATGRNPAERCWLVTHQPG